jgi:hypothetical protein
MTLTKYVRELGVRLRARALDDRGDIPGWVLMTFLSAGVVTLMWGVACDQLSSILQSALNSVKSP